FQRKEIKDVLAYFKYVINPKDDEAFKRIINYPKRGIGATTVSKLETLASANDLSVWEVLNSGSQLQKFFNSGTLNKLFTFLNLIKEFRTKITEMEAFDLAYTIATKTDIMKDLVADKTPEGISRYENLEELLNGIKEFTESEEQAEENSLSHYLQTITLYTDADKEDKEEFNRVTLMTIHAAKGLEFEEVFIVGMEEELFPSHMSSTTQKDLEEERRLFYVALTRAKKRVHLSYADMRYKWGLMNYTKPSRFIAEINQEYLEMPVEDAITEFLSEAKTKKFNGIKPGIHKKTVAEKVVPKIIPGNLKKIEVTKSDRTQVATDLSMLKIGVRIQHQRFGKGIIEALEGEGNNLKASVAFDTGQKKQLLLKFAKLEVLV
ncbi:MAG: ATP-binding domain-containing protein, partial [Bacteroidales bacterium]|nr:ATP-binding domain-containing protein [Bacteroidales bacterium]